MRRYTMSLLLLVTLVCVSAESPLRAKTSGAREARHPRTIPLRSVRDFPSNDRLRNVIQGHTQSTARGSSRFDCERCTFPSSRDDAGKTGSPSDPVRSTDHPRLARPSSNAPDVDWIANFASELVPAEDVARAITTDASGNIYVTGISRGNYLTVKYNSSGVQQWAARYDGPEHAGGEATGIAVDASGNVYVTGNCYSPVTSSDYATVKYNSAGVEQWVARYDGPESKSDVVVAVALDGSGNLYVTGWSDGGPGTGVDYATVKYAPSGAQLWVARYNSPWNLMDFADAIALDSRGNVYVTGGSEGSGTSDDFGTVKYDSSGVEQWAARYNSPANSGDDPSAIAVDGSGNVYVTGKSDVDPSDIFQYDYATVKYDAAGVEQWARTYDGPGNDIDIATDIVVDPVASGGDVHVTGLSVGSGTSIDYATVKYDPSGAVQWIARFDGPTHSHDAPADVVLDGSGNVYITGESWSTMETIGYVTVKYSGLGVEQWAIRFNGTVNSDDYASGMAVDASGNLLVTGGSYTVGTSYDYATVKYNASGARQWAARYDGPPLSHDHAAALTLDGSGNVYVTGGSEGGDRSADFGTVKYGASGAEKWTARFNGTGNTDDYPSHIILDGTGKCYVTGTSNGISTGSDYATVGYNHSGVQQWAAEYNGSGNLGSLFDTPGGIAMDPQGDVYVTGSSFGSGTGLDYATVKYNGSGSSQWVARYDNGAQSHEEATGIAVDKSGIVYVTGRSYSSASYYDYTTIKYDALGVEQWIARYTSPGRLYDGAFAIALDEAGNVYVAGSSAGADSSFDYLTIKYNASGVEQWVARSSGPGNLDDYARSITLDGSGNVYVTGFSYGLGTWRDYMTVKYDDSGVEQWIARYSGPGNDYDMANGIVVDNSGNVYVTGSSYGLGTSTDYATVKYDAWGAEQWVARYDGPAHSEDGAVAIALDPDRSGAYVIVTGSSAFPGGVEYTTIKYRQVLTGVAAEPRPPTRFTLHQNYPNPFNPSTLIRYALPVRSHVVLRIYNTLGEAVASVIEGEQDAGERSIPWTPEGLPSGIYFCRIVATALSSGQGGGGIESETKKIVLLR